ncbi:sensor histidine kinase [Microbispora triticiradicis]|uniref:sensor histidine kinase n=1 Tax=Microbispora triticiradicis TaxID=2200763 RepID=UPI001FCDEADA|nr:sensor domain-containing protein [Microbispora triticiradicis]MBO4272102.1 sensor histidine kinase [Microbispora triticiradicis]
MMAAHQAEPADTRRNDRRGVAARARDVFGAFEHLVGGLGTALLALAALVWLVVAGLTCVIGVGLLLLPTVPRVVRSAAERERDRLSRWGPEIVRLGPAPAGARAALAEPAVRRELCWILAHGTLGLFLGVAGLTMVLNAVQNITYPLWWRALPAEDPTPTLVFWDVIDDAGAMAVAILGVGMAACFLVLGTGMARLQAWPGRRLLTPTADVDLSLRIAELSATRAAALDAHAAELRRIERSLHDGAQNRLVAVTVMLGAARRALARDRPDAEDMLERAQETAEQALAELRTVVRGILPPVLADRGLAGALAGLAANCGVPCRVDVDALGRCPASIEATAYFVTAEALTNISKHSRARHATVTVRREGDRLSLRIEDDGVGGADERHGSGLTGIRSRVEAHDGRLTLTSPPGGPTALEVELSCGS